MNMRQIDLILAIVREQLEDYLAKELATDVLDGIRCGIQDNWGALKRMAGENSRGPEDARGEETGGRGMNRERAICELRQLIEFVETDEEFLKGYPVFLSVHRADIEAMRKAVGDMMNIEAMKAVFYPKED